MEKIAVFSPHFDDAILSMGNLLYGLVSNGTKVEIYNVFTKASDIETALTRKLLNQAGFKGGEEYFSARMREDRRAFNKIGKDIKVYNLGFTDAPWRKNKKSGPLYKETTWSTGKNKEKQLSLELTEEFSSRVRDRSDYVFAPLGGGKKHVDHILVRDACSLIFENIIYYADYSYGEDFPLVNGFTKKEHLDPVVYEGAGKNKMETVSYYRTQYKALFKGDYKKNLNREIFFTSKEMGLRLPESRG